MNDREFLMWIHTRLEQVFGESPRADYMRKLRAIIKAIPENQITPNVGMDKNLEELKESLYVPGSIL